MVREFCQDQASSSQSFISFILNLMVVLFVFSLQILCDNDSEVLVTLKEGRLFGEVSERPVANPFTPKSA